MENQHSTEGPPPTSKKFRFSGAKHMIIGTVGVLALLWLASYVLIFYETHDGETHEKTIADSHTPAASTAHGEEGDHDEPSHGQASQAKTEAGPESVDGGHPTDAAEPQHSAAAADTHADTGHGAAQEATPAATGHNDTQEDTHADTGQDAAAKDDPAAAGHDDAAEDTHADTGHDAATTDDPAAAGHDDAAEDTQTDTGPNAAEKDDPAAAGHDDTAEDTHADTGHVAGEKDAPDDGDAGRGDAIRGGHGSIPVSDVKGVTFLTATIALLRYELEERFYGWRPNDVINLTDNVENIQLGVLEVTRRTVEALTETISRSDSAEAYDTDLDQARNNLTINADAYMMPSAESSYSAALNALDSYKAKLENETAPFFTLTANLIPLLKDYENLLGSCDDNLVKSKEEDGSDVSWFRADDYFYYAQGVASAMQTILQAVAVDFAEVIETHRGVLHHAIEALHHALEIEPLIILDGAPDGFTANHRSNLAATISRARFHLALLIQNLST